jgi:DNA-binding transcriptional regulator PaaX
MIKRSQKAPQKTKISKEILKSLSGKPASSVVGLKNELLEGFLANIESMSAKPEYAISRAFKNLEGSGYIEVIQSDNKDYARLTREGKQKNYSLLLDNENVLVPTEWDGLWRIVMLDLPETRKSEREALRYLLKKAGFVCIKNSVWVTPYPYEHLFMNIKKDLGLTTEFMIFVTANLDPETQTEFFKTFGFK